MFVERLENECFDLLQVFYPEETLRSRYVIEHPQMFPTSGWAFLTVFSYLFLVSPLWLRSPPEAA